MTPETEIQELVNEVAPPPLVVSETALRQLRPLLLELIRWRKSVAESLVILILITLAVGAHAQVSVTTKCYNNARTCSVDTETILTPDAVRARGLPLITTVPLEGDRIGMEGSPLLWSGVLVLPNMANYIRGVRPDNGAAIWQTPQLCIPIDSARNQNDMWGTNHHFGALPSGVIDPDTGKLYQVAMCSKDGSGSQSSMELRMYVLDVLTGRILANVVVDGYSNGQQFSAIARKPRAALSLWKHNGVKLVIVEAGSFTEYGPLAGGWMLAFDTFDNRFKFSYPLGAGGWQSGLGPVIDDRTGLLYAGTGNGPFNHVDKYGEAALQIQVNPPTATTTGSFSILHAWARFSDASRTCDNPQFTESKKVVQTISGQSAPSAVPGANMPMKLDCSAAWGDQDDYLTNTLVNSGDLHLFVGCGKDGVCSVINADKFQDTYPGDFANPKKNCAKVDLYQLAWNLGVDSCPANLAELNSFPGAKTRHIHAPVVSFVQKGVTYLVAFGENSPIQVWGLNPSGKLYYVARGTEMASSEATGMHGGMPGGFTVVTSNKGEDAIAWSSVPYGDANRSTTTGRLIAYDFRDLASYVGTKKILPTLWTSERYSYNKFSTPVAPGNGKLYLANSNGGVMIRGN